MLEEVFARAERLRRHPLPHRLPALPAGAAARRAARDDACTAGWTSRTWCRCSDTFADVPLVSISDAQREPLPFANWRATVYHGLPPELYSVHGRARAATSRSSAASRPRSGSTARSRSRVRAGHAAEDRRQGRQEADQDYFEQRDQAAARPTRASSSSARSARREKNDFLGDARALLFPIDWPEPFGLVMIEAMACGTPVVAFRCGSVPEVMRRRRDGLRRRRHRRGGRGGRARRRAAARGACRDDFEQRFPARRMARDYVDVYDELVGGRAPPQRARATAIGLAAIDASDASTCDDGDVAERDGAGMDERHGAPSSRRRDHQLHEQFYILATSSRADDRTRVLKHGDTFAVFDRFGDIQPVGLGRAGRSTTTGRASCRGWSCGSAGGGRCCSARR